MSDEITQAITDSVAEIPGSDADLSVDTADTSTTSPDTTETAAETTDTTGETPVARPMSRSQARIQQLANERKADQEKYAADIKARDEERAKYSWALEDEHAKLRYDAMVLADKDPRKFAELLAGVPEYQQLITLRQAQEAAASAGATPDQGRLQEPTFPEPDAQYADGTPAHSPETIAQYVKNVANFVAQQADERNDKRFKDLESKLHPFVQERVDKELVEKHFTATANEFDQVKQTFGADFAEKMKPEMHTWMKAQWAAGRSPTLQHAVNAVLVPAVLKERDEARAEKLKAGDTARARVVSDMNTRAAAAERSAPLAGGTPNDESDDPVTSAIKGAIKNHPDR